MSRITRRGFLSGAVAAGAAAFIGPRTLLAATARVTKGTDLVTLGKSGLKPTLLGLGTGTRGGSEQLAIGQTAFTKMVRHALDRGIRYIDTADQYQTHLFVRLALTGVPRERYFIQTKTRAKNAEVAKADINRFRRELRVDAIDSLLMHCMTKGGWPTDMRPVMDELLKAKQRGHVKAVGISCHGFAPLAAAVDCAGCHDLSEPTGIESVDAMCMGCHEDEEERFEGMLASWQEDVAGLLADAEGRADAEGKQVLEALRSAGPLHNYEATRKILRTLAGPRAPSSQP